MKKTFLSKQTLFISLFLLFFVQCKKESERLNIDLINQPTSSIENYIQGKWKLQYMFGGICGACKHDRTQFNEFYEFLPNRRIIYSFQNSVLTDTSYIWTNYQTSPADYIHKLLDYGETFEFLKIVDDTLVFAEPFQFNPDYMTYHLTRVN